MRSRYILERHRVLAVRFSGVSRDREGTWCSRVIRSCAYVLHRWSYEGTGWRASRQVDAICRPVDLRVVLVEPVSPQDDIVVSDVRDVELGLFFVVR